MCPKMSKHVHTTQRTQNCLRPDFAVTTSAAGVSRIRHHNSLTDLRSKGGKKNYSHILKAGNEKEK